MESLVKWRENNTLTAIKKESNIEKPKSSQKLPVVISLIDDVESACETINHDQQGLLKCVV